MQIEHLNKMKNTPKIGKRENKGVSEQEILQLENKLNLTFPKAYKEFLFLGGKYDNMLDWDTDYEHLDWMQNNIKDSMVNVNLNLRPFFAFAAYDTDQYLFFFLDEGDNPPVYIYAEEKFHKNEKGEYVYYKKTFDSFSNYVNTSIDEALKK